MTERPGRGLDALVHDKVMRSRRTWVPYYSTSIAAAFMVVRQLQNAGFTVEIHREESFHSCTAGDHSVVEDTAPHAICLAALRAMGVTQEKLLLEAQQQQLDSAGRRWMRDRGRRRAS